jgi:hypothetical protein
MNFRKMLPDLMYVCVRTPHTPTGSKVAHKHAHTCRTQAPQVTRTKKRKYLYNKMCINTME